MREVYVIAHNIRSTFNVGSLLRTADGFGVKKVFFTGYTPYPLKQGDSRLPHISERVSKHIHKTALGAENTVDWEHYDHIDELLAVLQKQQIEVIALEQSPQAVLLPEYQAPAQLALLLGEEVHGIPEELRAQIQTHIEIPMYGQKESFNVVIAAAIALYHFSL